MVHNLQAEQRVVRLSVCVCARDSAMMNVSPPVNRDLCVTVRGCNEGLSLNESPQDSMTHSAALRL